MLNGRSDTLSLIRSNNARITNLNSIDINNRFNSETKYAHNKFTAKEDRKLRELIKTYGENAWNTISCLMGNKNQRQCRERWINYLSFNGNAISKPWTKEEDRLIILKYGELGAKWAKIANSLPGRSDNQVKLRFTKIYKDKHYFFIIKNRDIDLKKQQKNDDKSQEKKRSTPINNSLQSNIYNNYDFSFEYDKLPSEIIRKFCQSSLEDLFFQDYLPDYLNC